MSALPAPQFRVRPYQPSDHDAIMEIKTRKHAEWFPGQPEVEQFSPEDPTTIAVVVVVDENDQPVAAVGARRIAELGTAIDDERLSIRQIVEHLGAAWVMLGVRLHQLGYALALARVSSPTPRWGRTLEKRAGFQKSKFTNYVFDLEAVAKRLKPR